MLILGTSLNTHKAENLGCDKTCDVSQFKDCTLFVDRDALNGTCSSDSMPTFSSMDTISGTKQLSPERQTSVTAYKIST